MAHASAAQRLARLEQGVAHCLNLLEQGQVDQARRVLASLAGDAAGPEFPVTAPDLSADLSDQELDSAFEAARPDPEQVVDADRVAQEAMREADRALAQERALDLDRTFETRTMADLLEQQGDARSATRIRERLESGASDGPAPAQTGRPSRQRIVAQLERWIGNLREQERR